MAGTGSNLQRIIYPGFTGGLNLSVPPEALPKNELKEAINVEYSHVKGAMTVRGGLFSIRDMSLWGKVQSVAALPGLSGFIVVNEIKQGRYITRYCSESVGFLEGNGKLSVCQWDGYCLVASGGKLQRLRLGGTPYLETIFNSPDKCRVVFIRDGRVGVVTSGNEIRFSAVGDCEAWTNDPEDESSAQYLEIGYKDGMNIDAVIPLSRDLVIFKSPDGEPDKGTIFRLTGEYPSWTVLEVAHNTGTFSQNSVQAVGNDVHYAGVSGVASLSAVTSYGEIQAQWPDRKVNAVLSRLLSDNAEIWNVPVKQQLWIKPQKGSNMIWVLDYSAGIWTKFEFPDEPIYASGAWNDVYVFMGNKVYSLLNSQVKDDAGNKDITARLEMGTLLNGNQILARKAFVSFRVQPECHAELRLEGFRMQFSHDVKSESIYDVDDCAYDCNLELIPSEKVITSRRMCIVRGWTITPEVVMTGGGCALSTMGLEIGEV